jgi:hypothetical protein
LDLNATMLYKKTLWFGVTFRTEDAIAPLIGYQTHVGKEQKSMLRIGYSYDLTTSELSSYSSGSHEIMLSYCFGIKKVIKREVYKNVRFL